MENISCKKPHLSQLKRTGKIALLALLFVAVGTAHALAEITQQAAMRIAQQAEKTVTGTILDAHGEPLIGVTVAEQGTQNGAITDIDGNFTITVSSAKPVLSISYIGYKSQNVNVANRNTIKVTMQEDNQTLTEVVVTGFGMQQKKESLTGAISSINDKDISRSVATTVSGTLVGKIAGVNSRQADGRPGSSTSLQIRNMGTPLYVIDGVVKDEGQFNNLDANDIEQVSVLKDASAAIYGGQS